MMTIEDNCVQAVRCACKEPASTHSQNTTHTPTRLLDPTPPDQPHPAWPEPCKQMETPDSAASAPLGMNSSIIWNKYASSIGDSTKDSTLRMQPGASNPP